VSPAGAAPRRVFVINPNTTASMTAKVAAAARSVAAPATEIIGRNPSKGPPAIQGREDGEAALPGLFEEIDRAVREGADAVIIACFDDTGLEAARARVRLPVIGIGEAGFHIASLLAPRFSVVTTLSVSVPIIEANIAAYGFGRACARVRASGVAVLALEAADGDAEARVSDEVGRAVAEDRAGAVVLGCAGMADLAQRLAERHGLPVLDGVACAVRLAESLVALRLATSRRGGYAAPRAKRYNGIFAALSPR